MKLWRRVSRVFRAVRRVFQLEFVWDARSFQKVS
jgi:hypothetical protein